MSFLTEPQPARGVALPVLPGVRRIVAANPGPMTYHGTNTFLIACEDGVTVLDPGPDDAAHVAAIVAASNGEIARILVSHTHRDHVGAVGALRAATGAPVAAHAGALIDGEPPDVMLQEGDMIAGMTVLHTPGHAAEHVCFARQTAQHRMLFTGDHVMAWCSSAVSPPGGDMRDYLASLRRLLERADDVYLCGHGPMLPAPHDLVRGLLHMRLLREAAIASALGAHPATVVALTATLYARLDPARRLAAERMVLAHLLKLEADGRVMQQDGVWHPRSGGGDVNSPT